MSSGPPPREDPGEFTYGADAPTVHSGISRTGRGAKRERRPRTAQAAPRAARPAAAPVPPDPAVRAAAAASPASPAARPAPTPPPPSGPAVAWLPPPGAAHGGSPEPPPNGPSAGARSPLRLPRTVSLGDIGANPPTAHPTSRLTPSGRAVLAAGAVLCGLGWGLGYTEAVALGVASLAAVVLALAWTHSVPVLEARREIVPARVSRGETAQGVVVLFNNGSRTLRGLRAEDRVAGKPVFPVDLPPVAPGTEIRARYRLPTQRRGGVEVGPMVLVRSDPLGLTRRVRECGSVETLMVHPKTIPLPVLPAGRTHHLEGPNSDTADDGTLTFHSLREYVLGDDLRRVHWRSTARSGRLLVRRMIDVSLPTTTVVLDTSRDSYRDPEAFETAVDVAASVAESAARNHFPVRVLTAAGVLPLAEGHDQGVDHVLDRLASVDPEHDRTLSEALDVLERLRDGDTLVVVSGGERPLPAERLARLNRRFDRMLVVTSGSGTAVEAAVGLARIAVDRVEDLDTAWRREVMR